MIFIAFLIGMTLPALSGWLLLRLIEGKKPVLLPVERWALGFTAGLTLTMFLTFFANVVLSFPLTRVGFFIIQFIVLFPLAVLWYRKRSDLLPAKTDLPRSPTLPPWATVAIAALGLWTVARIVMGATLLVTMPPFLDDSFNNWNMRGKVYFVHKEIRLNMEIGNEIISEGGVHSYPPTVPLTKTWLATLANEWNEPLSASPHILWYIASLILVFSMLRRQISVWGALLGTYILASLPLYLVHGSVAYADVALSLHICAAVGYLYLAVRSKDASERASFFRISAVMAGLLGFVKNEGLLLHLLPLLVILVITLLVVLRSKKMKSSEVRTTVLWYATCVGAIMIPWVLFKWMNGLPFGNAKAVSGFILEWHPDALYAIAVNTFMEGNWIFLFPLLYAVLALRWRTAFRSPLLILTAFFLMVYVGQLPIYVFTALSVEALKQTGYARGLIHLAPIAAMLVTLLGWEVVGGLLANGKVRKKS